MQIENFIALDFETANQYRTSACALGLVIVEKGQVVNEWYSLIKPRPYFFSYHNIAVHGITADQVQDAPVFEEVWAVIDRYFKTADAIVAHNAPFDVGVLKALLNSWEIACDLPPHYCTYRLARKFLPHLVNHRLNTVSDYFNIPLQHHDALSDARAAARIMLELNDYNDL